MRCLSSKIKQFYYHYTLGAGIGVLLASLLEPLAEYFSLPDTLLINSAILILVVILTFALFTSLYKFKKKLYHVVKLEDLETDKIWIRPNSVKHFFQLIFVYFFFMGLTLLFCYFSILDPDIVTQIFIVGAFFSLIASPVAVTMGTTTVKFKGDKKTAV